MAHASEFTRNKKWLENRWNILSRGNDEKWAPSVPDDIPKNYLRLVPNMFLVTKILLTSRCHKNNIPRPIYKRILSFSFFTDHTESAIFVLLFHFTQSSVATLGTSSTLESSCITDDTNSLFYLLFFLQPSISPSSFLAFYSFTLGFDLFYHSSIIQYN